jgi:hypothetical protein
MKIEDILISKIQKQNVGQFLHQLQNILIQSLVTGNFFSSYQFFENNSKKFPNFFIYFRKYLLKKSCQK